MNNKNRLRTHVLLMAIVLMASGNSAFANIILAHSVNDWNAATNDGIGVGGAAVTAGSSLDAAQHGHTDTAGAGIWNYKNTDSPGGDTFSATPGFLTGWNGAGYDNGGTLGTRVGETSMKPNGTQFGGTFSVREWVLTGLVGETLNISGNFTTSATTNPVSVNNNGVEVYVMNGLFVLGTAQLLPNLDTFAFDINLNVISSTTIIRFAVGPQGAGPATNQINDFFNDSVNFSGQIEQVTPANVPEPGSLPLLLGGLGVLLLRRRHKY
ncbi:MAG: PEP-CTERM sorting domain-containing protein [Gammaproteobacteria bacterium]|nr:PEP-CTERM sorting domain-containing protein [Gammaproteobacteria bacterium]